jgi:hypothetical protein
VNGENLSSVRARVIAKEVERQIVPTVEDLVRSELKGLRNSDFDSGLLESDLACQSQASVQRISEGAASAPPASPGDERVGQVHSLGSFLKYNLFQRRDCVIAVPMRLGPVDPHVYELRFNPGVIASSGLIATRIRILCARIGWDY